MVIVKQTYRNKGKFKKLIEKDENDNYYNVITRVKKNNKWLTDKYYKYKKLSEANDIYLRL